MSCDAQSAKLLKEQGEQADKILAASSISSQTNEYIKQANKFMACGTDCQNSRKEQELLYNYQGAQMSLFNGTDNLESTSKNYYSFAKGNSAYVDFNQDKLGAVADNITKKYSDMFNEIVQTSRSLNNAYQSDFVNVNHAKDLYQEYLRKNKETELKLKNTLNDISTSDRKNYYEDQQLNDLRWWYYIYLVIYVLLFITFCISAFFVPTEVSKTKRLGIAVFLGLYIFVAKYIAIAVIKVWGYIGSLFPKNVYLSI
jgi:hypothetical protein